MTNFSEDTQAQENLVAHLEMCDMTQDDAKALVQELAEKAPDEVDAIIAIQRSASRDEISEQDYETAMNSLYNDIEQKLGRLLNEETYEQLTNAMVMVDVPAEETRSHAAKLFDSMDAELDSDGPPSSERGGKGGWGIN